MASYIPAIGPKSTNHEVRQFLSALLQRIDSNITNEQAWEMVKKFVGEGGDALEASLDKWQELFGIEHGAIVFKRLLDFDYQYVDKDTIWPILRHFYRIFILLLVIRAGLSFFEQEAFQIHKTWNIVAFVYYFSCYGFAYITASAKSFDRNPFWPEYLKIRPMGSDQDSWLSTLGYGG